MQREASADFADYWGRREDPDGVMRDRLSNEERAQYLLDVQDEFEFVTSLGIGRCLDVGCGPGWFLSELRQYGWTVAGVEVSPQATAAARGESIRVYDNLCAVLGSWDVVRCHHVIEHMHTPIIELERMHSALKHGGWLLLSTPDFGGPSAARFGDRYRMLHDKTHCSLFTLESCHRFLRDHGFTIQRLTFPFAERFQASDAMSRWVDGDSPPWPGNWMTFYCTKD